MIENYYSQVFSFYPQIKANHHVHDIPKVFGPTVAVVPAFLLHHTIVKMSMVRGEVSTLPAKTNLQYQGCVGWDSYVFTNTWFSIT